MKEAVLAGGCFWCTEAVFINLKGVNNVVSGYIGGDITNPTYKIVCSGKSGHLEAIKIDFDPLKIIAEHRVLKFFLFLLSHFPQLPSILGTPREFPEPKIISFVFMLN